MSAAPGSVKTFSCPNCGGSIAIRAEGISITATCQSCHALIDVANDNFSIISKVTGKIRHITIPIGSRGTLFDVEWEIIGYTERHVDIYNWEEYLLFNPWQGFRFLTQADGHWNFVKMLRQDVQLHAANTIGCDGKTYRLFSLDTAEVTYAMGEFYWRVKVHDKVTLSDYVAAPYVLTSEESDGEITWSKGIYVDHEIIKNAFNVQGLMPTPQGIAPNQPSPVTNIWPINLIAAASCVLLLSLQILIADRAQNKVVYSEQIHTEAYQKGQVFSSEPFELAGDKANVTITTTSPVYNDWLELNTSLTHEETQETFESSQEIEYYYGTASDGTAWSEGSQTNITTLSAIPGGKYRLLLAPDAGAYRKVLPADFSVTVKRDVPMWSNFFTAVFFLLLFPLAMWIRGTSFEKNRWAHSDFTPQK